MKTKKVFLVSKGEGPLPGALRERILQAAGELFLARGFVRVTAGDIAGRLGISKATLYKVFPSKEAVLRVFVRGMMADIEFGVGSIIGDGGRGFVEKMVSLLSFLGSRLSQWGPLLIGDIQKAVPGLWKEIEEFRREKILTHFTRVLDAGRREGYFRADLDIDILLEMFLGLVREFINPAALMRSGRSPAAAFESIIKVFFQGILTDEGRRDFARRTPGLFAPAKEVVP